MTEAGNQFAQTPDKVAGLLHKVAGSSGILTEAFRHVAGSLGKFDGAVCNIAEASGNVAEASGNITEASGKVAETCRNIAERENKFVLFQKRHFFPIFFSKKHFEAKCRPFCAWFSLAVLL